MITIVMVLAVALVAHVHAHEPNIEDAAQGGDIHSEWTTWEITCFNEDGRTCQISHVPDETAVVDRWVFIHLLPGETLKIGRGPAERCYAGSCGRLRTDVDPLAVLARMNDDGVSALTFSFYHEDVFRIVERTQRQATVRVGGEDGLGEETDFYPIEVATTSWVIQGREIGYR